MRALPLILLVGCTDPKAPPPGPLPIDLVWSASIQPGDLIVAVPGTGAYTGLGAYLDQSTTIDGRTNHGLNPIVLEQAIAAAQRAGIADVDIEGGAVELALFGAGTRATAFTYTSLGGLTVHFDVLGGKVAVANGTITDNLTNYTRDNIDADARDLAARIAARGLRTTVVAHSYGGAVAEYLIEQLPDPQRVFTVAAGVPALVIGYKFAGPGLRDVGDAKLYETDRPDDMVHNLNPSGNIEGHQYDIVFGDAFQGSYGITTMELSCHGVPGPC